MGIHKAKFNLLQIDIFMLFEHIEWSIPTLIYSFQVTLISII